MTSTINWDSRVHSLSLSVFTLPYLFYFFTEKIFYFLGMFPEKHCLRLTMNFSLFLSSSFLRLFLPWKMFINKVSPEVERRKNVNRNLLLLCRLCSLFRVIGMSMISTNSCLNAILFLFCIFA